MFTFLLLGACDPEDGSVELDIAEEAELAAEEAELHLTNDAEDAPSYSPPDESLAFSQSLDPSNYHHECYNVQIQFRDEPSGVCGGCMINGVYPGQKKLAYARECKDNHWGPWVVYKTSCNDC